MPCKVSHNFSGIPFDVEKADSFYNLEALRYLANAPLMHETKDTALRSLSSLSKKRPEQAE